ncbi:MAG TPA: outer membrane protein transport protein [Acidobacteriota bacterium]
MLKRSTIFSLLLFFVFVVSTETMRASGFTILELGARGAGMGGAFVAIADDGSALFYNPAGIAFQKGLRVEMDGFLVKGFFHFFPSIVPRGTIVPNDGYSGNVSPKFQILSNLFISKDLTSKWTLGFGVYSPFGLGDNWTNFKDSDPTATKFVGRFAGTRGRLENVWFQPTIAYRLGDNSSVAVGPAIVYTHIMLEQSILNPLEEGLVFGRQIAPLIFPNQDPALAARSIARLLPEGRSRIAGIAFAPGVTAGYMYKHTQSKTNFGVMWRSPVTYHVEGKASFAFTSDYPLKAFIGADTIPNLFPAQDAKASFTTPGTFVVGVANSSFWNSTIAFDFLFQNYKRFKDIPLNFTKTVGTATPAEQRFVFNFKNTYFLRAGIEKHLSTKTIVRGGWYFDKTSLDDKAVGPFFPDESKHVFTVGASRQFGNKEFSVFYQGAKGLHRTTNVPENANLFTNGEYRNFIHLIGFGLRIHVGGTTVEVPR